MSTISKTAVASDPPSRKLAERLHSGTLADVLDGFGVWGVLPSAVHCIVNPGRSILSQAYTTRWAPVRKPTDIMALQRSTWDSVSHFLVPELNTGAGKVYVAASEDGLVTEFALAGGFSCAYFERLGFDGIVLGGAVRDAHALAELSIPIWASNFIPADTQGNYQVKENGTWCRIGSVTIKTGDWIFSDSSGAVCIPVSIFDAVIARAIELEEVEMVIKTRVGQGERLFDVVRSLGRL